MRFRCVSDARFLLRVILHAIAATLDGNAGETTVAVVKVMVAVVVEATRTQESTKAATAAAAAVAVTARSTIRIACCKMGRVVFRANTTYRIGCYEHQTRD